MNRKKKQKKGKNEITTKPSKKNVHVDDETDLQKDAIHDKSKKRNISTRKVDMVVNDYSDSSDDEEVIVHEKSTKKNNPFKKNRTLPRKRDRPVNLKKRRDSYTDDSGYPSTSSDDDEDNEKVIVSKDTKKAKWVSLLRKPRRVRVHTILWWVTLLRKSRTVRAIPRRRFFFDDSEVSNDEGIGTLRTPKKGEVSVPASASKTNRDDKRKTVFTVCNDPQYDLSTGTFPSLFMFQEVLPPWFPLF